MWLLSPEGGFDGIEYLRLAEYIPQVNAIMQGVWELSKVVCTTFGGGLASPVGPVHWMFSSVSVDSELMLTMQYCIYFILTKEHILW